MKKLLFVLFLSGCKVDLVNDTFAKIYPKDGYADVATISQSCPLKVKSIQEVPLQELSGWVCMPEAQAAKYRREHEAECK